MIFFLGIISILISIAFALDENTKEVEYFDTIELNDQSIRFYVKDSDITVEEELTLFTQLSEDYGASFIRTDTLSTTEKIILYKSGIYTSDFYEQLDLNLAEGNLPKNKVEFLATYNTGDKNQTGRIRDIFKDKPFIMGSLEKFYEENEMSVNGVYTLIADSEDSEEILDQLSQLFNLSKEELLTATSLKGYGQGTLYLLAIILMIILIATFSLMSAFYPITRLKEIGVLKLLGYKEIDIWKKLNNHLLLIPSLIYFISIPIQWILIKDTTLDYFIKLTFIQAGLLGLVILFSMIMLIMIQRYKLSDILKDFFNFKFPLYFSYILKFFVFVGVIAVIPLMISELNLLQRDLKAKEIYEEQDQYITLSSYTFIDDESQRERNGDPVVTNKLRDMFFELEVTAEAEFIYIGDFHAPTFEQSQIINTKFENTVYDEKDEYILMWANENYLEKLNIDLPELSDDIISDNEFTYLIPDNLQDEFDKVELFIRLELESTVPIDTYESIENIPIHFVYYPTSNIEIFTENIDMIGNGRTFIKNPIIAYLDNELLEVNKLFLKNRAISNPIRIENTQENLLAIQEAITHNDLEHNSIQFGTVLSTGLAQELFISQTSTIAWISILGLSIAVSILASYYISLIILASKKKQMLVSKILGYSFFDRYQNEIFYFVSIYIFGFIEIYLLNREIISLVAYVLLVIVDILIIYSLVSKHEKKILSLALKGEE